jgi:hypothetical protein
MAATIDVSGKQATVTDGEWAADDAALFAALGPLRHGPFGPSGSDPNPDHSLAVKAAATLGGTVVKFDRTEHVAGRVY